MPFVQSGPSRKWIVGAQLTKNFRSRSPGSIALIWRKRNSAYTSMTSTAVAFANLCQVHHLLWPRLGPWVRANGNLGTETGFTQSYAIRRLRMQEVRNKLVVSLNRLVGNVKVERAIGQLSALTDQIQ